MHLESSFPQMYGRVLWLFLFLMKKINFVIISLGGMCQGDK